MGHISITGTKGKTTISRLVQHILMSEGFYVFGEYGNDGSFLDGVRDPSFRPADSYFSRKEAKEADFIISEATSYVLGLDVFDEHKIDFAAFTGFEETEHTELYETPEDYLADKRKIFDYLKKNGIIFVSRDSEHFESIVESRQEKIITYGENPDSNIHIYDIEQSVGKVNFKLNDAQGNVHACQAMLYGSFNVHNIAAAFGICQAAGIPNDKIIKSISTFPGIKGRGNVYHIVDTNTIVIIDYAHTPKSLEYQLKFLKETKGTRKLITIFGCGGNKSIEKRPEMGAIACKLSDYVVLTNDNPRNEDPRQILYDILTGMDTLDAIEVFPDREEAIKRTLSGFNNSLILIAGKGNEQEMEISGVQMPMSDFAILDRWIMQNAYSVRGFFDYLD